MKSIHLFTVMLMAGIIHFSSNAVQAQNVALTITGIKTTKGQMIVSVFKDEKSFKDTKPLKSFAFPKTMVVNGVLKVSLTLEPGILGLALLDDENGNGEMKKNMLGIPKEGFGFSNFYLSGMSRPSFDDFKFELKNAPVKLETRLRYM